MDLEAATPCGLIVTELVSNAIKYAFPGGRSRPSQDTCEIFVAVQSEGTDYTLVVADNGVGLQAGFDWTDTTTLGLRLVRLLGQHQLGGKIELDRTAGTRFQISFGARRTRQLHDSRTHLDRRG